MLRSLRLLILLLCAIAQLSGVEAAAQPAPTDKEIELDKTAPSEALPIGPVMPLQGKLHRMPSKTDLLAADRINFALDLVKRGPHDAQLAFEYCRAQALVHSARNALTIFGTSVAIMAFVGGSIGLMLSQAPVMMVLVQAMSSVVMTLGSEVLAIQLADITGIFRNRERFRMARDILRVEAERRFDAQMLAELDGVRFRTYDGDRRSLKQLNLVFETRGKTSDAEWLANLPASLRINKAVDGTISLIRSY